MKNILLSLFWMLLITNYSLAQSVDVGPDLTECDGGVIFFSYTSSGLTAPVSCLWDFGDGATSTMCNPDYIYVDQGTYTACVLLTDANNINVQDCVDITVFTSPVVEITVSEFSGIANNDGIICEGDATILDAGIHDSYFWFNGESTQTISITTGGDYTVTVSNAFGCTATDEITIISNPNPTPYIIGTDPAGGLDNDGDGLICDLPTVLSLDQSYTSYLWDVGSLVPTSAVTIAGTYGVTITNENNCTASAYAIVSPSDPSYTVVITDNGNSNIICPGETITLDAGASYLSYAWSTGETTQTITTNTAGNYAVTIMESDGCFNTNNLLVVESDAPEVSNITTTNITCGSADGALEITMADNTEEYTFSLENIIINQIGGGPFAFTGLAAGTYGASIINNNTGCETIESFTISDISIIANIVITNINDASCFGTDDGMIEYEVVPATGLTSHIESSTNGDIYNNGSLPPDNYCIIATDVNGCISGIECFDILEPNVLGPTGNTNALFCPGESVTLAIYEFFDNYSWSNGIDAPSIIVSETGIHTVTVTDANGCTATLEYNVAEADDCVWPGDANYDGIANNQDVLFLGMAYGNTGQIRDNANINWEGQVAEFEWDSIFNTGINQKHADSDGNGIVEQDDTLAIVQNYNLAAHELREMAGDGFPLLVNFDAESEDYGERIELKINLADVTQSVSGAYGIAFSLIFNYPEVINPSSIEIDFSNSVLGEEEDLITLSKILLEQGRMDFAITRYDHMDMANLYGELMSLSFIIEDNIDGFNSTNYTLEANPVDVLCVHSWGDEITLTGENGNILMLGSSSTASLPTVDTGVNYYPNPTKDKLHINMQDNSMIQQIRVFDTLGKLVTEEKRNDIQSIHTVNWTQGIYFLEITNDEGKQYLLKIIKE